MKRRLGILMACVVLLGLLAGSAHAEKLRFGQIGYNFADQWCEGSLVGFAYSGEMMDVDVVQMDAENNTEKMLAAAEAMINEDLDGICVFTLTPDLSTQIIGMCNDAGIPVVIENAPPAEPAGDYLGVSMLSYQLCQEVQFAYLGEKYPGSRVVFVSGSLGQAVAEAHMQGIENYMNANPGKIASLQILQSDWTAETSLNVITDYITSGGEFDVVVPNTGGMCLGVLQALKNEGILDETILVSSGGQAALREALLSGELTANTNTTSLLQGMNAFKILYDYVVHGERLPEDDMFRYVPPIIVTGDNIEDFMTLEDTARAWEILGGIEK